MHDYVADQLALFLMSEVADFAPTGLFLTKKFDILASLFKDTFFQFHVMGKQLMYVCLEDWKLADFSLNWWMIDSIVSMNFMGKYFQW